ncbi:MAG: DUF6279 family lipoprotein [Burkholderiales bacterium]|nr:DUF6279 family lipoprotein [Burkholderiales bacterium]
MMLALTALLSGCSVALKIGYNQGPSLAFRWLDGYVEFDDAQSLRVRNALDDWFAWHRRTQLPDYADLLARAQTEMQSAATPERMCTWSNDLRARFDTALERAVPALAEIVPTLSSQQIANIEKKYVSRNDEYRDDFLQRDPAKRKKAAVKREIERAEDFYGRLDSTQREFVARAMAESPWDGDIAYTERLRRQQDVLTILRRLTKSKASAGEAEAEVRAYLKRLERSPHEPYRHYAVRLVDFNCGFAAALHNLTTAEQRKNAAKKLKGYEDDLRALAAEGAS